MKKNLFIILFFCLATTKAQTVTPAICMVTTDTLSNNNIIYWDKTGYLHVDSFIVYREVMTNAYRRIGAQPYNALSKFVDTARSVGPANGDPTISAYRYELQIRDSSGNYSALSLFHTTVYIVNNGSGTFAWNLYTVGNATATPVSYFNLMRDDNSTGHFVAIGNSASTQTVLNDPNYSTYAATATWRVDAMGFNCTPTLRSTQTGATTISHSNPVNSRITGIKNISTKNEINIYPNPVNDILNVELEMLNEKAELKLFDVNGKLVLMQTINGKTTVDVSNLNAGVYNLSLLSNDDVVNKRVVVVK